MLIGVMDATLLGGYLALAFAFEPVLERVAPPRPRSVTPDSDSTRWTNP
jgi:hypothetical protein